MHFVAAGAELSALRFHEWFQEDSPVRFRIQVGDKVMQPPGHRVLAGGQLMQFGIFEHEVSLAHGAFYIRDGVAHHAAKPGPCFRPVNDLFDWSIKQAAVKQGGIVAPGAPF